MTACYEQYYQELQTVLMAAGPKQDDPLEEIQFRFQLAFQYTTGLPLLDCPITSIEYFKHWLPRFLAESKYYELLYHAEIFRPSLGSSNEKKSFWVRESNRLTRKIEEFPDLYAHYLLRETDRDPELFGTDPERSERNARVWADFMAMERYKDYLDHHFERFF